MADYQYIVDEIRGYLASPGRVGATELEPLAEEYARHCKELNERLRECQGYLSKGLRSEAIHLAEKHPVLLEVLTILDFAELADWCQACASLNLPVPPPLAIETAQALNDAYSEEMPLQSMLAAHRTLNLAQGPLEARVKVLRKIAAADAATLFWGDDLEAVERLRLSEIETQAREAEKLNDLGRLEALVHEVRDSNWRVAIPVEFKAELDRALQRLTNKSGEKLLRELAPRLNAAYSAMNLDECVSILREWDHIVKKCPHPLPADLLGQVAGAREWVAQEKHKAAASKAFEEACATLQAGLDRDVPTVELEKLFLATASFAYDVPTEIEQRYHQRLATRRAAARRRHQIIVAVIAAVVVVVLGASGLWFYQSTYNANVTRWVSVAKEAEFAVSANGDLQRGVSVRDSISKDGGRFVTNPDLAAEIARLDAVIQAEQQRDSAFKAKLAGLRGAPVPDATALKAAEDLALRSDEKTALQSIQDQYAQSQAAQQRQADQQFLDAAADLRSRIDKQLTADLLRSDRASYLRELAACDAALKDLENRPDVTNSTRQSITTTLRAVMTQASTTLTAADMDRVKIQAVAASKTSAQHQAALKDYLSSMESGAKRDSFTAALMRAQGDVDIESWDALANRWLTDFVPKTENEAGTRIKALEKYIADHPKSSVLLFASNYKDFLKRGMDAVADDGVWKRTLDRQMSGDLYTRIYMVETKLGKAYYTPDKPMYAVDSIGPSIRAYLSPDLSKTVKVNLDKGDDAIVQPPPRDSAAKSPQMIAAESVRASVRNMTFEQWPFIGLSAFEVFRTQEKCHPIVQAFTLLHISQLNQETLDWSGGAKLQPAIKQLSDMKLENMRWIDPDNQESAEVLSGIAGAVKNLPPAAELKQGVETLIAQMRQRLATGFTGRGCLIGMPNAPVGIFTDVKPENGMVALAVNPQLPKSAVDSAFLIVGHAANGKWETEASLGSSLPEGTFLFIASQK